MKKNFLKIREKGQKEIIYVYSKKVTDSKVSGGKKDRRIDVDKISNVVNSLLSLGKTKFFKDIQLKQNCKDWIDSILSDYPSINERDIKELLNDFTDSMNTRMREEEKYAVCIVAPKFIILCHSRFGEETITPKWEVIKRMLDKDNVLRYVYFEKVNGDTKLVFFEDVPSAFFADWLGIPEKEAFGYLGGKNRLFGEINGSTLAFEFNDEEFAKKFFEEKTFKIQNGQLILPDPIQSIPLVEVKVGRRPYNNVDDFIQDFVAKRYELTFYQDKYKELNSSVNFDLWNKKVIDDEYEVRDSRRNTLVKKTNSRFFIVFSNREIELRPSFLSKIKSKLLNNEPFKIFHAGGKVSATPIKIKNMEIYNELTQKSSKHLLDYFSDLSIKDNFEIILLYSILELLSLENAGKGISFFLKDLANGIISDVDFSRKFANKECDIIELKGRDFVSGDNKKIIENLSSDILTKIKTSANKIYLLGANENTKDFEPLPLSKFSDSRINDLEKSLRERTGLSNLSLHKIPANNGKDCLLILVVSDKNDIQS